MEAHIDKFGRVVIPISIRQHLGLMEGCTLEIEEHENNIVLKVPQATPLIKIESGIAVFQGKPTVNIEDAIHILREQRLKDLMEK